jgi:hypothetical protein
MIRPRARATESDGAIEFTTDPKWQVFVAEAHPPSQGPTSGAAADPSSAPQARLAIVAVEVYGNFSQPGGLYGRIPRSAEQLREGLGGGVRRRGCWFVEMQGGPWPSRRRHVLGQYLGQAPVSAFEPHLRGGPRARRAAGRAGLRPAGVGRDRSASRRSSRRTSGAVEDQASRPLAAQTPAERPEPTGIDYRNLPGQRCRAQQQRRRARQKGAGRMSIDRLRAHWGLSRTPVHQGAAALDAVRLGRPPGSRRQDRLDHH